jgi:hypothetical protein
MVMRASTSASPEAAFNGILDALRVLHDKKRDTQAQSRCAEVIALCCCQLASNYEARAGDVIQLLCGREPRTLPTLDATFVKNCLSVLDDLEEQIRQYVPSVNLHDTIVVYNVSTFLVLQTSYDIA